MNAFGETDEVGAGPVASIIKEIEELIVFIHYSNDNDDVVVLSQMSCKKDDMEVVAPSTSSTRRS